MIVFVGPRARANDGGDGRPGDRPVVRADDDQHRPRGAAKRPPLWERPLASFILWCD